MSASRGEGCLLVGERGVCKYRTEVSASIGQRCLLVGERGVC